MSNGTDWSASQCSVNCGTPGNITSTIIIDNKTWSLETPPLKIIAQYGVFEAYTSEDPKYLGLGDLLINSTWLQNNSICQPSDRYEWGFSSILLLIFCLASILFAIVLTVLHYDALLNSTADRYKYDVNHYRDAVDLVYELRDAHFGDSVRYISASELRDEIEMNGKRASLDTSRLGPSRRDEWKGSAEKR